MRLFFKIISVQTDEDILFGQHEDYFPAEALLVDDRRISSPHGFSVGMDSIFSTTYLADLLANFGAQSYSSFYSKAADAEFASFRASLSDLKNDSSLTLDQKETLAIMRIQSRIVTMDYQYTTDQDLYGTPEYWASPQEFFAHQRRGDCEDIAFVAQQYGLMAKEELGLSGEFRTYYFPGHLVCGYKAADGQIYIIDGTFFSEGSGADSHRILTLSEYETMLNWQADRSSAGNLLNADQRYTDIAFEDNQYYRVIPDATTSSYQLLPDSVKVRFVPGDRVIYYDFRGLNGVDPQLQDKVVVCDAGYLSAHPEVTDFSQIPADHYVVLSGSDADSVRAIVPETRNLLAEQAVDLNQANSYYVDSNQQLRTPDKIDRFIQRSSESFLAKRYGWLNHQSLLGVAGGLFTGISSVVNSFKLYKEIQTLQHMRELRALHFQMNPKDNRHRVEKAVVAGTNSALDMSRFGLIVSGFVKGATSLGMLASFAVMSAVKAGVGVYDTINMQLKKMRRARERLAVKENLSALDLFGITARARRLLEARIRYKKQMGDIYGAGIEGKILNGARLVGDAGILGASAYSGAMLIAAAAGAVTVGLSTFTIPILILFGSGLVTGIARMIQAVRRGGILRRQKKAMTGCQTYGELRRLNRTSSDAMTRAAAKYNLAGRIVDRVDDYCAAMKRRPVRSKWQAFGRAVTRGLLYLAASPFYLINHLTERKTKTEMGLFDDFRQEFGRSNQMQQENLIRVLSRYYQLPEAEMCLKLMPQVDLNVVRSLIQRLRDDSGYLEQIRGVSQDHVLNAERSFFEKMGASYGVTNPLLMRFVIGKVPLVSYQDASGALDTLFDYQQRLGQLKLQFGGRPTVPTRK